MSPERVKSAMDETEIKADIGRVSLELDSIVVLLFLLIYRFLCLSLFVLLCWLMEVRCCLLVWSSLP